MADESIVYVIDDDQAMVESLSWVIESVGFKVKTYTRAQDFLDEFKPKYSRIRSFRWLEMNTIPA